MPRYHGWFNKAIWNYWIANDCKVVLAWFSQIKESKMAILNTTTKYKIQITEITTIEYESTENTIVEERHYTDEEVNKSHQYMQSDNKSIYTKKIYGSRPSVDKKDSEVKVLEIQSNKINMNSILTAIMESK